MTPLRFPNLLTLAGWLTVAIPPSILIGKAPPDIGLSAVAVLFLIEMIRCRDVSWLRKPWILFLLMAWGYSVIRTSFVGLNADAAGWVRFVLFAAALGHWILPHEIWRKRLALSAIGTTLFLALDAIFQFFAGYNITGRPKLGDRLTSVFRMPKVGLNLSWFFAPLLAWVWKEKGKGQALGYGLIVFTAILLSGDRFAFLYTLSTLMLLSLCEPKLRRPALWGWGGVLAILAGAMMLFPDVRARQLDSIVQTITHLPETHYGLIWASALDIFKSHFFFGVGAEHYRTVCPDPAYGPALVGPMNDLTRCVMHPHHLYLEWAAELGLAGLGLFIGFIFVAGHQIFARLRQQAGQTVLLALGLSLAMRLFPLASSPSFYIAWAAMPFWLYLGWAMALSNKKGG